MKKIILLVGVFVLAMSAYAQTGGRANAKEPAPAASKTNRIPYQTKEKILFADGTLDEYTTSDWDSAFSHVNNEGRYSASGAMLEQVEFAYNDDKGYVTTKITRDVESRLKNRVVYQYNDQGELWRESLVDNKGKIVSTYEYSYDNKTNRTGRTIKNRAGDVLAETKYTFDSAGKMMASETKDFGQSTISSTKYQYDAQGNLTVQQVFGPDGKVTSTIKSVWQDGLELLNEMAGVDGKIQMRTTNEYGPDGELLKKTVENFQGESKQIMQYEYTFKRRG